MKKLIAAILSLALIAPALADGVDNPIYGGLSAQVGIAAGPATVRQITGRVAIPGVISGSNTQLGWRAWQSAYDNVSALQVCFYNGYVPSGAGETGSGGTATYTVYVEYPHGTWKQLTWSGSGTGTIASNASGCTDLTALGFTIPAYAKFRLTGDVTVGGAGKITFSGFSNTCDRANGDETGLGAGSVGHGNDDTVLGSGAAICYFPALVLGYTNKTVWGLVSDSQGNGVNDMLGDPSGAKGMFARALNALGPTINVSASGDRNQLYAVGANSAVRTALLAQGGAKSILLTLGVNDFFTATRTVDQVITDRATIVSNLQAAIPGVNVFYTTVSPSSTSTNGFVDTANQATSSTAPDAKKSQFNDFLRGTVSYTVTCTETTSNATLTACVGLPTTTVGQGMRVTGTGITGTTTVTAVNVVAGTVTVDVAGNVTGSGAQSLTFAWPSISSTFPTVNAGLVDVARMIECSPNQVTGPVANGGVWCPSYAGQTDGLHASSFGSQMVQPMIANSLAVAR